MSNDFSIIKLEDISKPAVVLIEKISNAVGGYFRPYQIRRVAKAEAEADKIKTEAQIEITGIYRRALTRFIAEEAKKQDNIESITEKSIPLLDDTSTPQDMDDDWITNFFDKCRIVSDEEMQTLWAKVLAGEANSPRTYSKRTVNLLGSLDNTDAQLFTALCGFVWSLPELTPLIYDVQASIYVDQGLNFSTLSHLDDIGLISFEALAGFKKLKLSQSVAISYYETSLSVKFKSPENNELEIGKAILTKTGKQLARICGSKPIDGFFDYVAEKWVKEGLILSPPYPRNTEKASGKD